METPRLGSVPVRRILHSPRDPARSRPLGQVGTGWECATEPSGRGANHRKGVEGKRWLANKYATDPEARDQDSGAAPDRLGDLGGAGSVSGRRCAPPLYQPVPQRSGFLSLFLPTFARSA